MKTNFETIIIGGGQAGLSVGRYLKSLNREFVILEQTQEVGTTWKNRYDSLVLDSFAKYSQLEDFPFKGDGMHQPTKDEVVEYLKSFKEHFDLNINLNTRVIKVEKNNDHFTVETDKGTYISKFVVLATGPFHTPYVPEFADKISPAIHQIHSSEYKNPKMLPPGRTLVVGKGNSGSEITEELSNTGRDVLFSYKGKLKTVQSTHFSQWLAYTVGLAHIPRHTLLGKLILWYTKGKSVGMDTKVFLKSPHIILVGECLGVEDGMVRCETGKIENIANIIWATGYKEDFSVLSVPGFNPHSQKRGVTNVKGLYVLNMRWQYSKSSSHLAGISRDASYIAKYIANNA